jgi:hypothetical protein
MSMVRLHRSAVMGNAQSGHVEQLPSESLSAAPTLTKLSDVTTAQMEAGDLESAILLAHRVSRG